MLWSRPYTFIPGSLAGCMNVGWNHEWTDSSYLWRSQYVDAQSHFSVALQSAFDDNSTGPEGAFKLVIFFGIENRRGPICIRCTCFQYREGTLGYCNPSIGMYLEVLGDPRKKTFC